MRMFSFLTVNEYNAGELNMFPFFFGTFQYPSRRLAFVSLTDPVEWYFVLLLIHPHIQNKAIPMEVMLTKLQCLSRLHQGEDAK